jgi:hypothetical protein
MVLEKINTGSGDFERHEFVTASDVKQAEGKFICSTAPRSVNTKFGDKLFVDVKRVEGNFENGDEVKTWVANTKSRNYLIDENGVNEDDWVSTPITLEILVQLVNGVKKEVIYAEGAV